MLDANGAVIQVAVLVAMCDFSKTLDPTDRANSALVH